MQTCFSCVARPSDVLSFNADDVLSRFLRHIFLSQKTETQMSRRHSVATETKGQGQINNRQKYNAFTYQLCKLCVYCICYI